MGLERGCVSGKYPYRGQTAVMAGGELGMQHVWSGPVLLKSGAFDRE